MPVSSQSKLLIDQLVADLPKLHFWSGEFSYGGFHASMILSIFYSVFENTPEAPVIVETGAGLSTLAFLAAQPSRLVTISVDPDGGLERRLREWAAAKEFDVQPLEYINDFSELRLPAIAMGGLRADVCMMDGGHGWPTVFVDFCYLNMCLKQGGYLIIDDLHLYSVSQLVMLLKHQPGWTIHHKLGQKTIILRKDYDQPLLPDFGTQPFIKQNSLFL
jgi:hypothetical protein